MVDLSADNSAYVLGIISTSPPPDDEVEEITNPWFVIFCSNLYLETVNELFWEFVIKKLISYSPEGDIILTSKPKYLLSRSTLVKYSLIVSTLTVFPFKIKLDCFESNGRPNVNESWSEIVII